MAYATRMKPGADLVSSIEGFAAQAVAAAAATHAANISTSNSCFVLSAVGSLQCVTLRMANASRVGTDGDGSSSNVIPANDLKTWNQRLEIVSLVGTLSPSGKHLHMSVSDEHGHVFGGHVMSGTIYTTLELVLGVIQGVSFSREMDPSTRYGELVVRSTENDNNAA
jgi:uncharacterized protein